MPLFDAAVYANEESTSEIKGHSVGNIVLSQTYPIEEVQKAVCKAATRREWTVVESTSERVVIYLEHRKYESTLTFLLSDSNIKIYSDSYKIKKSKRKPISTSSIDVRETERIKQQDPKGWIDNLKKDIPIYLDGIHNGVD